MEETFAPAFDAPGVATAAAAAAEPNSNDPLLSPPSGFAQHGHDPNPNLMLGGGGDGSLPLPPILQQHQRDIIGVAGTSGGNNDMMMIDGVVHDTFPVRTRHTQQQQWQQQQQEELEEGLMGGNNNNNLPFLDLDITPQQQQQNQSPQSGGNNPSLDVVDVNVESAFTALVLNLILFFVFMGLYELLSRMLPSVYSGRTLPQDGDPSSPRTRSRLPRSILPLGWVPTVARTSWHRVLETGGLDSYMFLRYIRMCVRITAVSGLWGMVILWPVFATGDTQGQGGWYMFSMANVAQGSWRIWFPTVFMWMLTFFVMFCMNDEYQHYLEKRMDFLGSGMSDGEAGEEEGCEAVHPQHHYSIMVEGIPNELRSDSGLYEYFNRLFPGKVHSTCMVLNIPDLEALSARRLRTKRRLEKSIAYQESTGKRPIHVVGRGRLMCCGIESITSYGGKPTWTGTDEDAPPGRPPERGERADSINYYTAQLSEVDREMEALQIKYLTLAESSNDSVRASEYITQAFDYASDTAASALEGRSLTRSGSSGRGGGSSSGEDGLILDFRSSGGLCGFIMKLGFDFLFAGFSFLFKHIDVVVDKVVGTTMSSTGFVTFYDLASVTCAASAPLSSKPDAFWVGIAPEPRDIYWENAHIDILWISGREWTANILLGLGAILWSVPLTFIQALASIESLSKLPGLSWLEQLAYSPHAAFINGYLPVLALLGLIMVLPLIFEWVAVKYEDRKTKSNVQASIVGRFFYYQLANIFITVTAGSIWKSLADILDHPSYALAIFGSYFPRVVGYFVTFIITKTLAGLPIVLLRVGALCRMLFLKCCFRESKLTQRELDEVYHKEMLQYGWEYPTQLLVIVICFTYACISPVILPVGAVYFLFALIVYKKQVLFVYTPMYESGGSLFPSVCNRTLIGLICGHITLMGYTLIKTGVYQALVLLPLPILTIRMMGTFRKMYADHSKRLSLERALEIDKHCTAVPDFSKDCYRQPVLIEPASGPMPYRRSTSNNGCGGMEGESFGGLHHDVPGSTKETSAGKIV